MLQAHCFDNRPHLFHLESHHKKFQHAKFQLNPLRIGWDIGCRVFCDSAVLHGLLQCCMATLDSRLDPFKLESHHAKFQLNQLGNGWDIGCRVFRDSAALHGILQCCRVTLLTIDLVLVVILKLFYIIRRNNSLIFHIRAWPFCVRTSFSDMATSFS